MNSELQLFENPSFGQIRVVQLENGEPMFCLADVCKMLDLGNPSQVTTRLNSKGIITNDTPTNGGIQKMLFINESNLYKCIFQSRKPEAEQITEWVTSEVLPSIRKTGAYQIKPMTNLQMLQHTINAMVEQEQRVYNLEAEVKEMKAQITTRPDYFSIAGFATLNGLSYGRKQCAVLGRKASKLCKEKGITTEQIHDPRFGLVKSYPSEVLKEVFNLPQRITIHLKVS